jgi:3-oxoadipate enol-lactonase
MKTLSLDHRFMSVAYDDVGTGVPVVLLHPFPFDRAMWAPQLEALPAAGVRVLAPDLPEFGDTTPGSEVFTIESGADVIADFLEALDIPAAVVGGLSMGGYVAMAFARRHPQRLRGLILADTKAPPDTSEGKANRDRLIADVKGGGPVVAAEAMLPKLLSESTRERKPAVVEFARAIILRQRSAGLIAGLYALRDRPDASPGLLSVGVPTLVLVGEHDAVTPPLAAARIAGSVPGSELVHIPDAGHLSNLENPEKFNAAVIAFVKKLQSK